MFSAYSTILLRSNHGVKVVRWLLLLLQWAAFRADPTKVSALSMNLPTNRLIVIIVRSKLSKEVSLETCLRNDRAGFGDSSGNVLTPTPFPRDDGGAQREADKVGEEKNVARRGQEQQDRG